MITPSLKQQADAIARKYNLQLLDPPKKPKTVKPPKNPMAHHYFFKSWNGGIWNETTLKTQKTPQNPLYILWQAIYQRCHNPASTSYYYYGGGKGNSDNSIGMHTPWMNSFETFANDIISEIGIKPGPGFSIDRIDNTGDYEPGNIRWAPPVLQARNRSNTVIDLDCALIIAYLKKYYRSHDKNTLSANKLSSYLIAENLVDGNKIKAPIIQNIYHCTRVYHDFV